MINLPNLCPNINHFDAADFSECYSEDSDKFLLTLSLCTAREKLNKGNHVSHGEQTNLTFALDVFVIKRYVILWYDCGNIIM